MVLLAVPVVVVGAATGIGDASGDVVGGGVAGDVHGDGAAGDKGWTTMLAVYGVGAAEVLQVRCRVNGGAPGESVVSAVNGVLLVMPWVPPVRGWWRGQGDSAVRRRDGGFSGVGEAGDAFHSLYRAGTKTPDGNC